MTATRAGVDRPITASMHPMSLQVHLSRLRPLDERHADRPVSTGVWRDATTGERVPVVVKRFTGPDALGRAAALHRIGVAVWASSAGFPRPTPAVPRPYGYGPIDDAAAVVMEALDGEAIGARGHLGRSVELASDAATLFADLHAAVPVSDATPGARPDDVAFGDPWSGVPRRPASRVLRSTQRKLAELTERTDLSSGARRAADALIDRMRSWSPEIERRGERLVVTHGDAAPRNVLATHAGLRLIDLDRVHLAGAGRDVAYWMAWSFATAWTGRPDQHPSDAFLHAYVTRRDPMGHISSELPSALVAQLDLPFHLAAAFVRIAHGWSVLRAETTLQQRVLEQAVDVVDGASDHAVDHAADRAVDRWSMPARVTHTRSVGHGALGHEALEIVAARHRCDPGAGRESMPGWASGGARDRSRR